MKKILVPIIVLFLTFYLNAANIEKNKEYVYKNFDAVRYVNNTYSKEKIKAKYLYKTDKIDLYIEDGIVIDDAKILKILNESVKVLNFEENLFGKLDDKLIILIMDINGGDRGYNAFLQGYSIFEKNDKSIKNDNSNIIFLDYINGWENLDGVMNTIIHELQHVIHYSKLRKENNSSDFDVWVDEALSEAAVIAYRGNIQKNRLDYYNSDSQNLITKGDYFINWNTSYTVHKYATVSLFMYWLGIQSKNGFDIYRDISNAPLEYRGTYKAILYAANRNIKQFKDWSELYATWLEANYKNEKYGLYGYNGKIETKPKIITTSYNCYMNPGSAVYVKGDFLSDDKLLRYVELGNNTYIVYNPDINSKGINRYLMINSYY